MALSPLATAQHPSQYPLTQLNCYYRFLLSPPLTGKAQTELATLFSTPVYGQEAPASAALASVIKGEHLFLGLPEEVYNTILADTSLVVLLESSMELLLLGPQAGKVARLPALVAALLTGAPQAVFSEGLHLRSLVTQGGPGTGPDDQNVCLLQVRPGAKVLPLLRESRSNLAALKNVGHPNFGQILIDVLQNKESPHVFE